MRWGVESSIDFQKNILQLESMSGLTPTTVLQDFYATVLIANLHFLLIKPAQEQIDQTSKHKKYPMQVNNNKAFGKIKANIIKIFISEDPIKILETLTMYFIRDQLPIRKGRSFPRVIKNKQRRCKHKTFTNYKPSY